MRVLKIIPRIHLVAIIIGICGSEAIPRDNYLRPRQRFSLLADAIFFDRVGTDKYTLVERVPGSTYFFGIPGSSGEQALNSSHLKQGFASGFRVGADYHVDLKHNLSASFFRIGDWDAHRAIGPDKPLDWLVMKAPGGFFQTQDFTYQSMKWDYSTKLCNAEINLQRNFSKRLAMLVGFRWLQLHENLQGTILPSDRIQPTWKSYPKANLAYVAWFEQQPGIAAPAYPPFWNTRATNNLYGLQVGLAGTLCKSHHVFLNGQVKLGGYLNHASEKSGVSIAKVVYHAGNSANQLACVSEVGLHCKYQIIKSIALKLGYEALWVIGVALAPGQIRETYSAFAPTSVHICGLHSGSSVFFHGGIVGLELSF